MNAMTKIYIRSHLKKRILVKYRGGAEFQPAVIHQYFEDLKRGTNKEIGPKDFFEIASSNALDINLNEDEIQQIIITPIEPQ